MNICEKVREIIKSFPKIALVCNDICVDFADDKPTSYGLTSVGDNLMFEDILGNQNRKHSFMLYTTFSGINDFERQENSVALTELSVWLSKQIGDEVTTEIDGEIFTGQIIKMVAGNGKLFAVPDENSTTRLRYQLQIEATYTIEF